MNTWLYLPLAMVALLPMRTQETSILGFVQEAVRHPPRTSAEAERILHDQKIPERSRHNYAIYETTVRTTDGVETFVRFIEPVNTNSVGGPTFQFDFSGGHCYPREEILLSYPTLVQDSKFPRVWAAATPWGSYHLYFDETPRHCLVGYLGAINKPTRPLPPGY